MSEDIIRINVQVSGKIYPVDIVLGDRSIEQVYNDIDNISSKIMYECDWDLPAYNVLMSLLETEGYKVLNPLYTIDISF